LQRSNSLRFPTKFQNFCSEFSGLLFANVVDCPAADQQTSSVWFGAIGPLLGDHGMSLLGPHEPAAARELCPFTTLRPIGRLRHRSNLKNQILLG
jgi:hypothetical protein